MTINKRTNKRKVGKDMGFHKSGAVNISDSVEINKFFFGVENITQKNKDVVLKRLNELSKMERKSALIKLARMAEETTGNKKKLLQSLVSTGIKMPVSQRGKDAAHAEIGDAYIVRYDKKDISTKSKDRFIFAQHFEGTYDEHGKPLSWRKYKSMKKLFLKFKGNTLEDWYNKYPI